MSSGRWTRRASFPPGRPVSARQPCPLLHCRIDLAPKRQARFRIANRSPITIQLVSQANPAPTFALVSGPAGIVVDPTTGAVTWTPDTPDVGAQTAVFRATNSVGSADLSIDFDILPDTPKLSVQLNPTTGEPFATAGVLFNAQVIDSSTFPSTFELLDGPAGMTMDSAGLISWTPTAEQGGINVVTVRGTNAGGSSDLDVRCHNGIHGSGHAM